MCFSRLSQSWCSWCKRRRTYVAKQSMCVYTSTAQSCNRFWSKSPIYRLLAKACVVVFCLSLRLVLDSVAVLLQSLRYQWCPWNANISMPMLRILIWKHMVELSKPSSLTQATMHSWLHVCDHGGLASWVFEGDWLLSGYAYVPSLCMMIVCVLQAPQQMQRYGKCNWRVSARVPLPSKSKQQPVKHSGNTLTHGFAYSMTWKHSHNCAWP